MLNSKNSGIVVNNQRCLYFDDIFLASYPRSGNTWMRLLLSDLILQKHGFETDTELPIPADKIVPGIEDNKIISDARLQPNYQIIKTHWFYSKVNEILAKPSWTPKVIYLFRNPADSLCSFFYLKSYLARMNGLEANSRNLSSIEKFCLKKVDRWCQHLKGYIHMKESDREKILFISYESMHEDLISILKNITEFIGFPIDEPMAEKAIENHRFEKKKTQDPSFFRKGKIGSSKEELSSEVLSLIEEKTIQIYNTARNLEYSNL